MRGYSTLLVLVCIGSGAALARADTLDFEDGSVSNDASATLSDEYADRGVYFTTSDDGAVWGGMSGGDVGGWQIEGSSGPAFLGFDGNSYQAMLDFDGPVADFRLDASRAQGAMLPLVDTLLVAGFLEGGFTGAVVHYLGDVNQWETVALDGEVDQVFIYGSGISGMRFGIDNLSWEGGEGGAPAVSEIEIDIRPGSEGNPVNPASRGVIPVLTYGSADLDVEAIDRDSIRFGPGQAGVAHRSGPHFFDADADGWLDMLTHHRTTDSGLTRDDFEACLYAETSNGVSVMGCDGVTPVPR